MNSSINMRFIIMLLLVSCVANRVSCRPPLQDEETESNEAEEAEYEGNEDANPEELRDAEEEESLEGAKMSDEESPSDGRLESNGRDQQTASLEERLAKNNEYEGNFEDEKYTQSRSIRDYKMKGLQKPAVHQKEKRPQYNNKDLDMSDTAEADSPYMTNPESVYDVNNDILRDSLNKRTISKSKQRTDSELFQTNNEPINQPEKEAYNELTADSNDQSERNGPYRQYQSPTADNKPTNKERMTNGYYANRDRRDASSPTPTETSKSPIEKSETDSSSSENEEAVIKRHIKNLSDQELQQLLNSLSDDKRELLKSIMERDFDNTVDAINKREITKKAGAAEDNFFSDNGQFDLSKIQCANVALIGDASTAQSLEKTTVKLKTAENEPTNASSKSPEANLPLLDEASLANSNGGNQAKHDTLADSIINNEESRLPNDAKVNEKRDTNVAADSQVDESNTNYLQNTLKNQGYVFEKYDDLSQLLEDETRLHSNIYKRDADNNSLNDIKSLEESFPKSNAYDESSPYGGGSDMAPLVRVKRKNLEASVKKRAAALLNEDKISFVPYKAENDDEDNEEGSEFEDDGLYDRTANFADVSMNVAEEEAEEEATSTSCNVHPGKMQGNTNPQAYNKVATSDFESDTPGLGSDTDSVLTGVEGGDENIMYNGAQRNKRNSVNDVETKDVSGGKSNRVARSTPLIDNDNMSAGSDNYLHMPNYQESDSFGPLPRNYEGELDRHKRIRRVKQPLISEKQEST